MRASVVLLTTVLALLVASRAPAEPDARGLKIATFDLGKVEASSTLVKEGKVRIDKEFAAEKAAFEQIQAEFRRLVADLRGSIYRPGSPEHRQMLAKVRAKEAEMKKKGSDLLGRLQAAKNELLIRLFTEIRKAIASISESDGYDLVFQIHAPDTRRSAVDMVRQLNAMDLFHAHPRFDITDRIIAAMNPEKK